MKRSCNYLLSRRPLALLLLLAIFVGAGCGQGSYDARMKERLAELKYETPFLKYLYAPATKVPTTEVSFRLPTIFDSRRTKTRLMGEEERGKPIDPIRIQPPFAALPGFLFSYEKFARFPGEKHDMPIYCYIGVVDGKLQTADQITAPLLAAVKGAMPDADPQWETRRVPLPGGGSLTAKRLSVIGPQRFDCTPRGGDDKPYDGRFDLYLITTRTQHVLLGWRAPLAVNKEVDFFAAAEAAVGTLRAP